MKGLIVCGWPIDDIICLLFSDHVSGLLNPSFLCCIDGHFIIAVCHHLSKYWSITVDLVLIIC